MKLRIEEVRTKVSERGTVLQSCKIPVYVSTSKRAWKDAWIPVERSAEPYSVGVYTVSDRSFYVNSYQGVGFFPRLEFVSDLEDDSIPDRPVAAVSQSADIPF